MGKKEDAVKPGDPIEFTAFLHLIPEAKGRPRFGQGRTYTPSTTRQFENALCALFRKEWGYKAPLNCPLSVEITCYLPRPKRPLSSFPIGTPDLDNLVKAVTDSLNKLAWTDDSRIVDLVCRKRWASVASGVAIRITNQVVANS